jgi:hypothetical protein
MIAISIVGTIRLNSIYFLNLHRAHCIICIFFCNILIQILINLSTFVHRFRWTRDPLFVHIGHHAYLCPTRLHPHLRGQYHILHCCHTIQMPLIDHCYRVRRGMSTSNPGQTSAAGYSSFPYSVPPTFSQLGITSPGHVTRWWT